MTCIAARDKRQRNHEEANHLCGVCSLYFELRGRDLHFYPTSQHLDPCRGKVRCTLLQTAEYARLGAPRASMTPFQLVPPQKSFKHIVWFTNVCLVCSACDNEASTSEFVPESHQEYDGSVHSYEMTRPDEPGSPPEDFRHATITVTDILTLLLLVAYIIYVTKACVYKTVLCIQVSSAS